MSTLTAQTALVLRTCDKNLQAYQGFQWPADGEVAAPDWNPAPVCGGGLHGLLWGDGDACCLDWSEDAKWLVVQVVLADVVYLDGKVKFPMGTVVHCGDRASSTEFIVANGGRGRRVVGQR